MPLVNQLNLTFDLPPDILSFPQTFQPLEPTQINQDQTERAELPMPTRPIFPIFPISGAPKQAGPDTYLVHPSKVDVDKKSGQIANSGILNGRFRAVFIFGNS